MPTFPPPQYAKSLHPTTGAVEACYTFTIQNTDSEQAISLAVEDEASLSCSALEQCIKDNKEWWDKWVAHFLESTTKHFSKPYTVLQLNRIIKQNLVVPSCSTFPATILLLPECIQIRGGIAWVNWKYTIVPMTIDIPDMNELPDSHVEEVDIDDVPQDATEESFELDSPTKNYDKHKVREARLKAKIAMYKAQHQMTKYYEKYGTEATDSDIEESDDSEEEEVQL
jgi:hypothetical protein